MGWLDSDELGQLLPVEQAGLARAARELLQQQEIVARVGFPRDALRRMGEAVAIDCCTHSVVHAGGTMCPQTEWRRPGIPPSR